MAFIDPYKNRGLTLQDYARVVERGHEAQAEREDGGNAVTGVIDTAVDLGGNVLEGAGRSLEGIFDMVAGVVGGVGGLISKDFREGVQDVIEFDATSWVGNEIFNRAHRMLTGRDIAEDSYLKEDGMIEQILRGVGGMLPAVAVSLATGGAGAPMALQKASQALSMATMATGAAGQATQEAYLDGAGYYQGLAYGGIRGATEVATEKMFGGLDAGLFGKGFLPDVAKSVADTGVKRFVKGALQEGAEEMASEFFDPAARSVYQGKEAYKKYLDPSFYGDVGKAGVVGTLTGAAFSGTVGRALSGGSVAEDVQSVMTEVDTLERKRRNLFANDQLTDEADTRIGEDIRENYRVLEGVLKKAPESKRAAVMEQYELSRWFDEDGGLKPEFSARLDTRAASRQTATEVENGAPAGSAGLTGRFDRRYHDPDAEDASIDAALSRKGRAAFAGELSKEGKARYRSLKKVMNTFSRVSGDRLHFVIAEESPDTNAYYDPNTDMIVIGADVLEQGDDSAQGITQAWFEATLHEVTHAAEGTAAYGELSEQLEKLAFMPQVYEQLAIRGYFDNVNNELGARLNALLSKESLTEAEQTEVGGLSRKVKSAFEERIQYLTAKDALTAEEEAELSRFLSESTAIMAERVLNSESFVRRLVREDTGLVEKLLIKIADIKEAMTRVGDKVERDVAKEIKAAEDQLLRAVSEAGYRFDGGKIVGAEEEEPKESRKDIDDQAHGFHQTITAEMSEKERAEILRNTTIQMAKYKRQDTADENTIASLQASYKSKATEILLTLAEKFGVFNQPYQNENVSLEFQYSRSSLKESTHKQNELTNDFSDFAKMLTVFDEVIQNAVPIEVHTDRYAGTKRANVNLKYDYVLLSAFSDADNIVPVEFNIKQFKEDIGIKNKLYVSVTLGKIKEDNLMAEFDDHDEGDRKSTAKLSSDISIPQLIANVNPHYGNFLKYIPSELLNEEQEAAKGRALEKDEAYLDSLREKKVKESRKAKSQASGNSDTPIEYQLPEDPRVLELRGDQRKALANWSRNKVYTRKDAMEIVDAVIGIIEEQAEQNSVEGKEFHKGKILRKVREKNIDRLFADLNTAATPTQREAVARTVAEALMSEARVEVLLSENEVMKAFDLRYALQQYRGKMDLSEIEKDAKELFGKGRTPLADWRSKEQGRGMTPQEVKADLQEKAGLVMLPEHPLDIFLWLDKQWHDATDKIFFSGKYLLKDSMETEEYTTAVNALVQEILDGFAEKGHKSAKAAMQEEHQRQQDALKKQMDEKLKGQKEYHRQKEKQQREKYAKNLSRFRKLFQEKSKSLQEEIREVSRYSTELAKMRKLAQGVKDWRTGRYHNSTQPSNVDFLKSTIGKLAEFTRSNVIDTGRIRTVVAQTFEWYESNKAEYRDYIGGEQKLIGELTVERHTTNINYSAEIAGKLYMVAKGSGKLTVEEIRSINDVLAHFKHITENYNKIWRNGKLVDAAPIAKHDLDIMRNNARLRVGVVESLYSSAYMRMYGDPHMLVKYMDKYQDGFFTRMYREIRDGLIFSEVQLMRMRQKLDVLTKEEKHYFNKLKKETVNLHGATMPKSEAMSLYLTANREQALAGLLESGYSFVDDLPKKHKKGDGKEAQTERIRRVFGFTGDEKVRDKDGKILPQYRQMVKSMQDEIYAQLSETDKQFMKITSELLQNDCKRLKVDTDMKRMGYTNILEEFYYPIRRANTFKTIEQESFFDEVGCVANQSFNKNIDRNAKNQLFIEPLEVVLNRHMRGVCLYAGLGTVVDNFDTLKHIRVEGTNNKPISIATEMDNAWVYGTKYFEQLMKDVKGIRPDSDELTRLLDKIRGNYAKFALAANPKVIMTQLSSVFAASNLLDYGSLVKGFSERGRDVFDFCELAELRAYENQAAMAQGLIDKAGDKLMQPIGWTDSFVVRRLFVACQHQVAKDRHLTLGTPENKQAAGELLREVILETQQNALATEKSEAARSHNVIQKMITMFTSDAVKLMGRVLDAFGEVSVIKRAAFVDKTAVDAAAMKKARKRLGRALGSLGAVAIYTMLLSMGVKWFLNKDDEEMSWTDWLSCFFGTLLGGLPIISDVYDRFFGSGYGLEDMSISAVNDIMDSFSDFFGAMGSFAAGDLEGREAAKAVRSMLYSIGQVSGLPIRNVYNWSRGFLDKISSDAVYKLDNLFYKQSYNADIKAAIEAEDEDRLATVVGVMLDENVGEVTSSAVRQEMNRLVIAGMDVLPRGVGDTVTYEGQSVKLMAKQKAKFREVYGEANEAVSRMVTMKLYATATDEAKAKAIKRLYGIYYNRAIEDLLGVSIENKNVLMSRAVDPAQLSIIAAVCAGLTADVGKDGKAVSGSKKAKVVAYLNSLNLKAAQKHLILGYLGYKNTLGEEKVRAYLAELGLSEGEAEALLEIGGY